MALIVSFSMGTLYCLPVRLSVIVKVSSLIVCSSFAQETLMVLDQRSTAHNHFFDQPPRLGPGAFARKSDPKGAAAVHEVQSRSFRPRLPGDRVIAGSADPARSAPSK